MRKVMLAVVSVLLVITPTAAGAAIDPEATFRTERVYFKCVGDVKVQNVARVQTPANPWNTTAPAQSVQEGAGCGHVEAGVGGPQFDLVFEGTFTGNVDALTVHLHAFSTSEATPNPTEVLATLNVNGTDRLAMTGAQRIAVSQENSGVTVSAPFTVTGLGYGDEVGDGTQVRTFKLTIGSPIRSSATWVWDTTEVPAGITFNPKGNAPTVFAAQ